MIFFSVCLLWDPFLPGSSTEIQWKEVWSLRMTLVTAAHTEPSLGLI